MHACILTYIHTYTYIEFRHLIPAPVDRTSTSAWLYKHPQKNKSGASMIHVSCKSKLHAVVGSS